MYGLIVLRGDSSGKNFLQQRLLRNYWIWNVNPINRLKDISNNFSGYTGDNPEFINKLRELLKDELNFEYEYIKGLIDKTKESIEYIKNNKLAQLLIIHGIENDLLDRLINEFPVYEIRVLSTSKKVEDNFQDGRFVLGCESETFETDMMDVISMTLNKDTQENN